MMNMYDIAKLEEKLGYEKWVLREAVLAVEKHHGTVSDQTVVFQLNGTKSHIISISDELGAHKRVEMLEKLSPLLFVTSYKIIDMIFEWILEENVATVPFQFSRKIELLENHINQSNLILPAILISEKQVVDVLFSLYKEWALYRNKIIHGNWGTIINGSLNFSFTDKGTPFQLNIDFKNILNLAEIVSNIANELLKPSDHSLAVFVSVKYLLDTLSEFHRNAKFNVQKPRYFKAEIQGGKNMNVNNKDIRDYLFSQSSGMPISYTLLIRGDAYNWKLPWNAIKDLDQILLNDDWDEYMI